MKIFLESFIGCATCYAGNYYIGYWAMKLFGYTEKQSRFVGAFFSSPHTVSIPVTLMPFIAPVLDKFSIPAAGLPASAKLRGFLYIIPNSIWTNIWRWSGVNYLVEADNEEEANKVQEEEFSWKKFFSSVINMPVIAAVGSLLLCLVPGVQDALNEVGAWLNNGLMGGILISGHAYTFLVILTLGLSISDFFTLHPDPELVKKIFFKGYDIVWFTLIKLLLCPVLFAPFYILVFKYWLNADDMAFFLFMLLAASPPAINMILVCSLKSAYVETVSTFMVIQYGLCIITLTFVVPCIVFMMESLA